MADQALAVLCEAYWYPIYAYIRRTGRSQHDAEDLTQGFFARLLERAVLAAANPGKGRLRTFLLACVRNFLSDERERARAQKRGAAVLATFDSSQAEERYASEPGDDSLSRSSFPAPLGADGARAFAALAWRGIHPPGKGGNLPTLRPFLGFGPEAEKRYDELAPALSIPVATYASQGLKIVSFTEQDRNGIEAFTRRTSMDYIIGTEGEATFDRYGVTGIPAAFVVDKTGSISWEGNSGDAALEGAVQAAIGRS